MRAPRFGAPGGRGRTVVGRQAWCRPTAGSTRRATAPRSPRWPGRRPTTAKSPRRAGASCASPSRSAPLGQSASPTSPAPTLGAALRWDGTSHPLSVSSLDDELQERQRFERARPPTRRASPTTPTTSTSCSAKGSFSQSFDLWTLRRVPRRPPSSTATRPRRRSAARRPGRPRWRCPIPADGFTSSATLTLQSATLGFFAPSGTTLAPNPDQAVLSVVLDAEFPNDPDDPAGSGHYLGATTPLPASLLTFTPTGASAVPATLSDAGDTTGKGNSDDGLFDATYSFLVPATLSTGTLEVAAGSFSGAEFTLYTAESGTTTLDISAPATLALSFPAPVAEAAQRTPPWVGQPDPPTAVASSAPGSHEPGGSSGSHGFPIWAAIVILLVIAAGVVLFERRRRSGHLAAADLSADESAVAPSPAPSPAAPVVPAGTGRGSPGSDATSDTATAVDDAAVAAPGAVGAQGAPEAGAPIAADSSAESAQTKAVNFVGPRRFVGFSENSSRILEATLTYLLCHDAHHLSADQIALGMWPYGRSRGEATRKTIQNNASALRNWIGAEHLPDAAVAGGYLIEGIDTDWAAIERLSREAQTVEPRRPGPCAPRPSSSSAAFPSRASAGDGYDWIEYEGLVGTVTVSHRDRCARDSGHRPLREPATSRGAEDAARAGLRGARAEFVLWELGARAIDARGDRRALEAWWRGRRP